MTYRVVLRLGDLFLVCPHEHETRDQARNCRAQLHDAMRPGQASLVIEAQRDRMDHEELDAIEETSARCILDNHRHVRPGHHCPRCGTFLVDEVMRRLRRKRCPTCNDRCVYLSHRNWPLKPI